MFLHIYCMQEVIFIKLFKLFSGIFFNIFSLFSRRNSRIGKKGAFALHRKSNTFSVYVYGCGETYCEKRKR